MNRFTDVVKLIDAASVQRWRLCYKRVCIIAHI